MAATNSGNKPTFYQFAYANGWDGYSGSSGYARLQARYIQLYGPIDSSSTSTQTSYNTPNTNNTIVNFAQNGTDKNDNIAIVYSGNPIYAGAGDDIIGSAGGYNARDYVDGGAGNDLLEIRQGDFSTWKIAYSDSSKTWNLTNSSQNSSVVAKDVENIKFGWANPVTISIDSSGQKWVSYNGGAKQPLDIITPNLLTSTPTSTLVNNKPNVNILLQFNEAVTAGSGNINFYKADGTLLFSTPANGNEKVSFVGNQVKIQNILNLDGGKDYYITIDPTAIKDTAGNNFAGLSQSNKIAFTTVGDSTNPILNPLSTANNVVGLSTIDNLTLTFSENVRAGNGSIMLRSTDGLDNRIIAATDSQVSINGNQVVINPTQDLLNSKTYYLSIDKGAFKDLYDNQYQGTTSSQDYFFKTTVDKTAPKLTWSSPADDSSSIQSNANIYLNFDEAVQAGTGRINIYESNGSIAASILASDTKQVTFNGQQVIVNPTSDLAGGKSYYVNVDKYAIKDSAGNGYAGISDKTSLNFTTGDYKAPTLTSFLPADNTFNVAVDANIVLNFDEEVKAGSGYIKVQDIYGNINKSISVTDSSQVSINGKQVTINPLSNMLGYQDFYVTIDSGAFKDLAGNSYAGISDRLTFNFTTANNIQYTPPASAYSTKSSTQLSSDRTAPTLGYFTPWTNSTNVSRGSNIELNFNEAVKAGKGNFTIRSADGTDTKVIAATDRQVSFNGQQVVINPTADLLAGKTYYVTIDASAISDLAGNAYLGISNTGMVRFNTAPEPVTASQNVTTQSTLNFMSGTGNIDILNGTANNDNITSYEGDDILNGYGGNDTLSGGFGNDKLYGGSGQDTMYGGLGADTFLIGTATDSLYGAPDLIADYSKSQGDVIDLSAIDAKIGGLANDSFSWLQGALNSSNANGALWFSNGTLFGSTNSDTNAEFAIRIQGATSANDLKVNM